MPPPKLNCLRHAFAGAFFATYAERRHSLLIPRSVLLNNRAPVRLFPLSTTLYYSSPPRSSPFPEMSQTEDDGSQMEDVVTITRGVFRKRAARRSEIWASSKWKTTSSKWKTWSRRRAASSEGPRAPGGNLGVFQMEDDAFQMADVVTTTGRVLRRAARAGGRAEIWAK